MNGSNIYSGVTDIKDGTLSVAGGAAISGASGVNFSDDTTTAPTLNLLANEAIGSLNSKGANARVTLNTNTLTLGQDNTTAGSFAGVISGDGGLTKTGTGNQTLTGANTYTGLTTVSNGRLIIGNNSALGTADSGTTVADGASLQLRDGITVTGETLTLTGSGPGNIGALQNVSGNNTWAGDIFIAGNVAYNRIYANAGHLTITGDVTLGSSFNNGDQGAQLLVSGDSFGAVTITGNITGGNTGSIAILKSMQGPNTLTLSGANTYKGHTYVSFGTFAVSGGEAIPDDSYVFFNKQATTAGSAATFTLLGSETIGSLGSIQDTNGSVSLNEYTLTTGADNTSTAFYGGVSGTGGLIKVGLGTQTLAGQNTYTGDTQVDAGALVLASTGSLLLDINNAGEDYSQLLGTGQLTLDGMLNFDVSDVTDTAGTWDIVTSTLNVTYNMAGLAFSGGPAFSKTDNLWTCVDGDRTWTFTEGGPGVAGVLSLTTNVVVPEPGTLAMLIAGLVGLAVCGRKKRRA